MKIKIIISIVVFLTLVGCRIEEKNSSGRLKIVCTTGMISDAVINIVGDDADVYTIMGPGTDPHLYKPTPQIIQKLEEADVIIHNGLHLEGKMTSVFEKLASEKHVLAMSDGIDKRKLIESYDGAGVYDPHIWFDLSIWAKTIDYIGKELILIDTTNAKKWKGLKNDYIHLIKEKENWVISQIKSIPQNQRVLITSHDAFRYFGNAYGIEVIGLQGISTVSEFGLKDISEMVTRITDQKIKAVFVESSVSRKSMEAVKEGCESNGHQLNIGGTLYSDAMGSENTKEGTYLGMIEANVNTIVNGLK